MIIGLTGAICAGKKEFASYLVKKHGFKRVNLIKYFKAELKKRGIKICPKQSPLEKRPKMAAAIKPVNLIDKFEEHKDQEVDSDYGDLSTSTSILEAPEGSLSNTFSVADDILSASPMKQPEVAVAEEKESIDIEDDNSYCFFYFQTAFKQIRAELVKEVFKQITGDWQSHYVVYPLSSSEDIRIMISRYYFILFEVDAPISARYKRFLSKYPRQKDLSLEQFVEIDDLINFNKEQYSMYKTDDGP